MKTVLFRLQSTVVKQGGDRHLVEGWLTHRMGRGEIIEGYRGLWMLGMFCGFN